MLIAASIGVMVQVSKWRCHPLKDRYVHSASAREKNRRLLMQNKNTPASNPVRHSEHRDHTTPRGESMKFLLSTEPHS